MPHTDPNATPSTAAVGTGTLLNKRQLAEALGLKSTRTIDGWVKSRRISFHRTGHRTLLFDLDQVREDLKRFEVKAIGRTKK